MLEVQPDLRHIIQLTLLLFLAFFISCNSHHNSWAQSDETRFSAEAFYFVVITAIPVVKFAT